MPTKEDATEAIEESIRRGAPPEEVDKTLRMGRPQTEFPDGSFKTIYADGVLSFSHTPGVVKFYLHRHDSNLFGRGGAVLNPNAQIVMPHQGFVQMVLFLQKQIKAMISQNVISKDFVDQQEAQLDRIAALAGGHRK